MSTQGRAIRGFTEWLRAQHYEVVEIGTRPQHVLDLDELARRYLGEPEPRVCSCQMCQRAGRY